MKSVIILLGTLISLETLGQKISKYSYKNVDTLDKYKNAEVIKYKDKFGKAKSDTIYFNKQKAVINIDFVSQLNIYDKKLKQ